MLKSQTLVKTSRRPNGWFGILVAVTATLSCEVALAQTVATPRAAVRIDSWPGTAGPECRSPARLDGSSYVLDCDDGTLRCTTVVLADFVPAQGAELVVRCTETQQRLASIMLLSQSLDLIFDFGGNSYMRVDATFLTRSHRPELIIVETSGDWGALWVYRWSVTRNRLETIFNDSGAIFTVTTDFTSPQLLEDPGAPATLETCAGTWTWRVDSEMYELTRRRRGARPRICAPPSY